ncbi:1-hydroxy-2-methyl-2-(E)-butenyl 4-diphosphate synthase [Ruminiclostridium papyrosolvens DSM 2782]|uniref:4-hydroxy-3-methylbut-2-en-1-yl diphosphate synthase (flavodoxin) n=1 Tax=Ruminiclostridium papyrosolvens DSM 2782 TaxID=588581 RepID=F1TG43_9FIRM|nr:flavodoxin-dependent (E)-4-hydroxy-3-methylbut-2-enyl-diphosphate synthase [Ruminiclostridium papyrosolvens]EGD46662.1 1-hydroxy-2-methyl-2-(E)-butenyl 4-diphosphate synthase [Ruminiclostridium papyrosolvens DSM 2782]WES35813.1 flavodoxin-dependent (E)-4-hydroxy-3-methylbut-2-enyl-diphosphate synthase [Ruminiclostridium papyrosolvens DSM 2782]
MEDYIQRKKTKKIRVGDIFVGGDSPISVQSMTNTDTRDIKATVDQIKSLEAAGCDIVRLAILDNEAATAIGEIKKLVKIPLVADIHYDYRLAVECMKNGVDKIRLNPGNIGGNDRVKIVAGMAKERGIPIRIGVNSGSVEKGILDKFGGVTAEGMVESALAHVAMLENVDFNDIAISIKASSVPMTIAAYRLLSEKCSYPLHVGVTEAGTVYKGTIKSSVGIGCLLAEGIGDTIRVSLTGDPVEEIKAGKQILKSLGLLREGIEIVSCPTCGRTQVNLIDIANSIEPLLEKMDKNIKVAIMGCAVNGPGEAKDADIGIAGGVNEVLLFKKGRIIRKIPQENVVEELLKEISQM